VVERPERFERHLVGCEQGGAVVCPGDVLVGKRDGETDARGLRFPGEEAPDYWDFLHFAVIVGVASQTADIAISSKPLRRLCTVHALFSFAFNTVVVALTINLLAGLFG